MVRIRKANCRCPGLEMLLQNVREKLAVDESAVSQTSEYQKLEGPLPSVLDCTPLLPWLLGPQAWEGRTARVRRKGAPDAGMPARHPEMGW